MAVDERKGPTKVYLTRLPLICARKHWYRIRTEDNDISEVEYAQNQYRIRWGTTRKSVVL